MLPGIGGADVKGSVDLRLRIGSDMSENPVDQLGRSLFKMIGTKQGHGVLMAQTTETGDAFGVR